MPQFQQPELQEIWELVTQNLITVDQAMHRLRDYEAREVGTALGDRFEEILSLQAQLAERTQRTSVGSDVSVNESADQLGAAENQSLSSDGTTLWRQFKVSAELRNWDKARECLIEFAQRFPEDPRGRDVKSHLDMLNEAMVFDLISPLMSIASRLPAAVRYGRFRGDWRHVDTLKNDIKSLLEAARAQGHNVRLLDFFQAWFDQVMRAKDAQALLREARSLRRRGEFALAVGVLNDAQTQDPQILEIQEEQSVVDELNQKWRQLRPRVFNTSTPVSNLAAARTTCEELLDPQYGAPDSNVIRDKCSQINNEIEQLVAEIIRRIGHLKIAFDRAGDIEDRLQKIGEATNPASGTLRKYLEDLSIPEPHNAHLQDDRAWANEAYNDLSAMLEDRDRLLASVASIDPRQGMSVQHLSAIAEGLMHLQKNIRSAGDRRLRSGVAEFGAKLEDWLVARLSTDPANLAALEGCSDLIDIADDSADWPESKTLPYRTAILQSAETMVRHVLPTTLPSYDPTHPRSDQLIEMWSRANTLIEWLKTTPPVSHKVHTVEMLERQFAGCIDAMLLELGSMNLRTSAYERQERVASSLCIREFVQTLPPSIVKQMANLRHDKTPAERSAASFHWRVVDLVLGFRFRAR